MPIKALFLCSELSGYFFNCLETLNEKIYGEVRVYHLIYTDGSPYEFKSNKIVIRNKTDLEYSIFRQEVIEFDPDILYVAGWINKDYNRIARHFVKKRKVVICGIDNSWTGNLRQRIVCLLSTFLIKPSYTHMWVAGRSQFQFARELKYPQKNILSGVYAADVDRFINSGKLEYQKELLFVGRFEKIKGVEELYSTFLSLSSKERNGWKLRMIGNGTLKGKLKPTDDIIIEPFMQPEVLAEKTQKAGAFILPSKKEPWGVVVHEFAAAGLPLILSDTVNAGEEFLISNYNGFTFKSSDLNSLREVMIQLFSLEHEQIVTMGMRSQELALSYTPRLWASVFLSPLKLSFDSLKP